MSRYMFMAADFPLTERKYQRPQNITIMTEGGFLIAETDEQDTDFMVQRTSEGLFNQVLTEKEYGYELWFDKLSDKGKNELIEYIKENLCQGGEIEFWNAWLGGDEEETDVEYWEVPVDKLTADDIEEFENSGPFFENISLEPWAGEYEELFIERFTQYCMIVKGD